MKSFDQSLFSHSEISITLQLKGWKMVWPNRETTSSLADPLQYPLASPTATAFPQVFPQKIDLKWLTLKVQLSSLGKLFLKFWPSSWLLASLSPLEIFDITSTYYVNQTASACLPTIILWLHLTFTANWRAFWPTLLCQLAVVFCQSSPWVNFRVNSQSSLTHHVPQNEWDTRMTALTLPYAS